MEAVVNQSIILDALRETQVTWKGERVSHKMIGDALVESKEVLKDQPTGTQYQRGGLIVRKETSETYDVYVFAGSLN